MDARSCNMISTAVFIFVEYVPQEGKKQTRSISLKKLGCFERLSQ
jgi:hypothetical protein